MADLLSGTIDDETSLAKPLYNGGDYQSLEQRIIQLENHEQGDKVQFVFTSITGRSLGIDQVWSWVGRGTFYQPPIGYGGTSSLVYSPAVYTTVLIPAGVVVNSAILTVYAASVQTFTSNAHTTTAWRQAAQIDVLQNPIRMSGLYDPYGNDSFNYRQDNFYTSNPADVIHLSDLVWGGPWVPTAGTAFTDSKSMDVTAYMTPGTPKIITLADDSGTVDHLSLAYVQLIVSGFTRNR